MTRPIDEVLAELITPSTTSVVVDSNGTASLYFGLDRWSEIQLPPGFFDEFKSAKPTPDPPPAPTPEPNPQPKPPPPPKPKPKCHGPFCPGGTKFRSLDQYIYVVPQYFDRLLIVHKDAILRNELNLEEEAQNLYSGDMVDSSQFDMSEAHLNAALKGLTAEERDFVPRRALKGLIELSGAIRSDLEEIRRRVGRIDGRR